MSKDISQAAAALGKRGAEKQGETTMTKITIECKGVPNLTVEHLAKRIAEIADVMTAGAARVSIEDANNVRRRFYPE